MPAQKQIPLPQDFDQQAFDARYDKEFDAYEALVGEVKFILTQDTQKADIKIHNIEGRVKEKDSILGKCAAKQIAAPFEGLDDIAGCRVICLFRSDFEKIETIIRTNFLVKDKDDKVQSNADSFGYMSIHYTCQIKNEFNGPRYEAIKNRKFEIQVRTLSMHAWAEISHYLDYKGEWDVPVHLKKGLNALSGLFYVADDSFEKIYFAREDSKKAATSAVQTTLDSKQEINLDTILAYLQERWPKRGYGDMNSVSELVKELKQANYDSIGQIEEDVNRAAEAFERYEEEHPPASNPRYNAIGLVRSSLRIASKEFFDAGVALGKRITPEVYRKFEPYLKVA